ncbi:hypothetical protein OBBRIDRAFT_729866 [Obba rivulosa]|uniref:Hsp90 chaperone protein kinase-targeting subunit n=1 Tax=Obba rivulosa TaxID=1052685 RepID=A0A8E2B2A9_9APHY|nr:hypothetical protein OBBRIDRAFT_729866 [Obba rivulosa]
MPLNYSKWDALELSDDSDIEGHPNVDKRSLIRWKQRDIHEKREVRKYRIAELNADIACNEVLESRLRQITDEVEKEGPPRFSALVEKFKTSPSPDAPPTNAPGQKTYDEMLLALLLQVWDEAKKDGAEKDDPKLGDALVNGLKQHIVKLGEHQEKFKAELVKEEEEQKKKITMDDLHEGFDSHYVPPKPEPPPLKGAGAGEKKAKKATTTEIEVLNPKGVAAAQDTFAQGSSSTPPASKDDDDDTEIPEMTPTLEEFSRLPIRGYEESWEFIKAHRDVVVAGASDALLVAGFRAQTKGQQDYALRCVHQSLLLQYCDKLGAGAADGVKLFFKKMIDKDPRAIAVFEKDVADTYAHIVERVRVTKAEEEAAGAGEQIQLVPENPGQGISFNVPDGPPPDEFTLEGPGLEGVDINDVRRALQMRWDVFSSFDPALQEALKEGSLDKVNKVLGNMKVEKAEEVVKLLDLAGILNFSESTIRDETGRNGQEEDDEDEEEEDEEEEYEGGTIEDVNEGETKAEQSMS